MDAFFNTIDDSLKLTLDGAILHDTAIIPDFAAKHLGVDVVELWTALSACETLGTDKDIDFDPNNPRWIPGEHVDLNYRGNSIARSKMWFQQDISCYRKYSYTGWNNGIAKATYATEALPPLATLCNKLHDVFENKHNHWIVTKYDDKDDCIGLHSDKTHTWEKDSCFMVIKLGGARPFQFSKPVPVLGADGLQKTNKDGKLRLG
jgi:hypothetical protein